MTERQAYPAMGETQGTENKNLSGSPKAEKRFILVPSRWDGGWINFDPKAPAGKRIQG